MEEETLKMNLENLEPFKTYYKDELARSYNVSYRQIRHTFHLIKKEKAVISLSRRKGYIIIGDLNQLSKSDIMLYKELIEQQLNETLSRINKLSETLGALQRSYDLAESLTRD